MSIASEITRLQGVKSDILQAIANKGVTVPAGSALDDCPGLIADIPLGQEYTRVFLTYFANTSGLTDTPEIGNAYTLSGGSIIGPGSSGMYLEGAARSAWNVSSGWHSINLSTYVQNKKKAKLTMYVRIPSFGSYAPMKAGLDFNVYFRYPGPSYDTVLGVERYNFTSPISFFINSYTSDDNTTFEGFNKSSEPFFKTSYEIDFEAKTVNAYYKDIRVFETRYSSNGVAAFVNPVSGGNISVTGISLDVK